MSSGLIKACGMTRVEDALAAVEAGFDAVGLVFAESPRRVNPRTAREICSLLPSSVLRVGVFLGQTQAEIRGLMEYCGLDLAQLHEAGGTGLAEAFGGRALVAIRPRLPKDLDGLDGYRGAFALLIDAWHPEKAGGTGITCDWTLAARAARASRVILAGGLSPDNVAEAINRVRPFGVDVSSGVEAAPGIKDPALLRRFARAAKAAFESLRGDAGISFKEQAETEGASCVGATPMNGYTVAHGKRAEAAGGNHPLAGADGDTKEMVSER
ncbi:MAG: phosphoribosylanthranilate isomerase [Actinobacteria bacterium]|nr:phosphoribosylanthranilate isomerase [Actinomycetota bacterium]